MTTRESYRILGVTAKTDLAEVRSRFRLLAQKYHPDRNPDNPKAAAQFRRLVEAYETVQLHLARTPRSEKRYYRSRRTAKQEFFEEILGINPGESPAPPVGPDFRYDFRIPFVDALVGLRTTIMVPRLSLCPRCQGSGRVVALEPQPCPDCRGRRDRPVKGPGLFRSGPDCRRCRGQGLIREQPCPACEGKGQQQQFRTYHLDIPAGTEEGARFRFAGEGGESFRGGPPGNLEVVISVEPHEFFTRKGRDLHYQCKVSFAQAAMGGEVQVPTLWGSVTLTLPKGTPNGCIFRFPAHGAPGGSQQPPGDQIVEVVVASPERLGAAPPHFMAERNRMGKPDIKRAAHE